MNGKTAKKLRRNSRATGVSYKSIKRAWGKTPVHIKPEFNRLLTRGAAFAAKTAEIRKTRQAEAGKTAAEQVNNATGGLFGGS